MKRTFKSLPAVMLALLAQTLRADFDIRPVQPGQAGKIVTDGFDDDLQQVLPAQSAFGYGFEDPDNPFSTSDPGFNAPGGSLTPSSHLFLLFESNLKYWNGSGAPAFGEPITSETVQITKTFGSSATAYRASIGGGSHGVVSYLPTDPGNTTAISALRIGSTSGGTPGGFVHEHMTSELFGSDGNAFPAADGSWGTGDGIQAADGIYAFQVRLFLSTSNSPANEITGTRSDVFWIVYNNRLPEERLEEALSAFAVPEPATASALALGAVILLVRRKKIGKTWRHRRSPLGTSAPGH